MKAEKILYDYQENQVKNNFVHILQHVQWNSDECKRFGNILLFEKDLQQLFFGNDLNSQLQWICEQNIKDIEIVYNKQMNKKRKNIWKFNEKCWADFMPSFQDLEEFGCYSTKGYLCMLLFINKNKIFL